MADIRPFRAYRYNPRRVALAEVLTQPYDKITPEMQERYYALSPYNLISIEKGRTLGGDSPQNNVYTRARDAFQKWVSEQILVRDPEPAIYVYVQEYIVPGTSFVQRRRGFIALGRIEDYSANVVFRHENTLSAPKADRLELLRQTRAQTGLLFMLYDDSSRALDSAMEEIERAPATMALQDEYGVGHSLWGVSDARRAALFTRAMYDKKLVIADGHHRYETALNFRDECRAHVVKPDVNAPHEFAMMAFFNTRSKGLTILPTHRLVAGVGDFDFARFHNQAVRYFDWYAYPFVSSEERQKAFEEFRHDLEKRGRERHTIGIYAGTGSFYLFVLRHDARLENLLANVPPAQRRLDVVLLHRLLLKNCLGITAEAIAGEKNIRYEREMSAAIRAVDAGEAQLACFLNPVRVQDVVDIALAGEVMPQKSTDFFPKLLSGLTIHTIEET